MMAPLGILQGGGVGGAGKEPARLPPALSGGADLSVDLISSSGLASSVKPRGPQGLLSLSRWLRGASPLTPGSVWATPAWRL